MTAFINLNKEKFAFIFKVLLFTFAILLTSLYFLPLAEKPIFPILIAVHLGLSFLIASIVVTIIYLTGYFFFSRQETIFSSNNLKEFLSKYDFETEIINCKNKWQLAQRIKTGKVNGYPIVIFKRHDKWNFIIAVFELELKDKIKSDLFKFPSSIPKPKIELGENEILVTLAVTGNIEGQIMQLIKLFQENHIKPVSEKGYP